MTIQRVGPLRSLSVSFRLPVCIEELVGACFGLFELGGGTSFLVVADSVRFLLGHVEISEKGFLVSGLDRSRWAMAIFVRQIKLDSTKTNLVFGYTGPWSCNERNGASDELCLRKFQSECTADSKERNR